MGRLLSSIKSMHSTGAGSLALNLLSKPTESVKPERRSEAVSLAEPAKTSRQNVSATERPSKRALALSRNALSRLGGSTCHSLVRCS